MNAPRTVWGLVAGLLLAPALSTGATMINVDLGNSTTVGSGTAGVVASDGWQQKSGFPDFSGAPLNYADGSASGATLSADGVGNYACVGASTADGDYLMFNRNLGIEGSASSSTLTFTGLDLGGVYDVYVYVDSNADSSGSGGGTFSISDGTTTYYYKTDATQASYQGTYVQATATASGDAELANYVKFSGLTSSSLTITASRVGNLTAATSGFAGLQVVAVPEPATMGLLALGLPALLRRRRA